MMHISRYYDGKKWLFRRQNLTVDIHFNVFSPVFLLLRVGYVPQLTGV